MNLDGLNRLKRRATSLKGTHRVPLTELFQPAFMRRCSRFATFEALFETSPFVGQDFDTIPDSEWHTFIRQNTRYSSWQAMINDASAEWAASRLLS
jgi:hypothetical protein